jgi:hypothetical protein
LCVVDALSRHPWTKPDEHLAHIFSREQAEERLGRVLNAIDNGFLPPDPAVSNPRPHVGIELWLAIDVVGDDETRERQPLAHRQAQVARPGRRLALIILGDHTAQGDPASYIHVFECGFKVRAANVLEVDVDAVWAVFAKLGD